MRGSKYDRDPCYRADIVRVRWEWVIEKGEGEESRTWDSATRQSSLDQPTQLSSTKLLRA